MCTIWSVFGCIKSKVSLGASKAKCIQGTVSLDVPKAQGPWILPRVIILWHLYGKVLVEVSVGHIQGTLPWMHPGTLCLECIRGHFAWNSSACNFVNHSLISICSHHWNPPSLLYTALTSTDVSTAYANVSMPSVNRPMASMASVNVSWHPQHLWTGVWMHPWHLWTRPWLL